MNLLIFKIHMNCFQLFFLLLKKIETEKIFKNFDKNWKNFQNVKKISIQNLPWIEKTATLKISKTFILHSNNPKTLQKITKNKMPEKKLKVQFFFHSK